jgi:hypothetical protein
MEGNSDTIIISSNKGKILKLFVGSIVFIALSYWIWNKADFQTHFEPLEMKIVAIAGAIFFGIAAIFSFYKLFDRNAGLVIDVEGIHDNSSAIGSRIIKWNNITGLSIEQIQKTKLLILSVNNAEELISAESKFKRWLMSANYKKYGTPIVISSTSLNITFDELVKTISGMLEKYKSKMVT